MINYDTKNFIKLDLSELESVMGGFTPNHQNIDDYPFSNIININLTPVIRELPAPRKPPKTKTKLN